MPVFMAVLAVTVVLAGTGCDQTPGNVVFCRVPSTAYRNQPPGAGVYAASLSSAPGGEQWPAGTPEALHADSTFTADGCVLHGSSVFPVVGRMSGTVNIALTLEA